MQATMVVKVGSLALGREGKSGDQRDLRMPPPGAS